MTAARFPTPAERARRARLIEMLDEGKVLLQVAPRHPEVDLPDHLRGELVVGLAISRRFGLRVLELGPLAVKAELSFGGERYLCVLPWLSIFSMKSYVTDAQAFFPESVPGELLAGLALARAAEPDAPGEGSEPDEASSAPPSSAPPPEEPPEPDDPDDPGDPPKKDPPPGPPRLRLVRS